MIVLVGVVDFVTVSALKGAMSSRNCKSLNAAFTGINGVDAVDVNVDEVEDEDDDDDDTDVLELEVTDDLVVVDFVWGSFSVVELRLSIANQVKSWFLSGV